MKKLDLQSINELSTDKCDITSDDDIWLIQSPKTVDIGTFINRKMKLPGKTHLEHIESVAEEFSIIKTMALGTRTSEGFGIKIIPLSGRVIVRQRLKTEHVDDLADAALKRSIKATRVPFPEDLKVRHPLHGIDYEKRITIKDCVAVRLDESSQVKTNNRSERQVQKGKVKVDDKGTTGSEEKQGKKRNRKIEEIADEKTIEGKLRKVSNDDDGLDLEWIKSF